VETEIHAHQNSSRFRNWYFWSLSGNRLKAIGIDEVRQETIVTDIRFTVKDSWITPNVTIAINTNAQMQKFVHSTSNLIRTRE
jgi:hypothetical protein